MVGRVARLVSGGQTGVDRAALEIGHAAGIPIGGWCPAGGWAEDLPEPPGLLTRYPELRPTPSGDPAVRTRWNVRDSDATLVLTRAAVTSPGTTSTIAIAEELDRPHLVADPADVAGVRAWLDGLPRGLVLNVAGPRESEAPGIHDEARALLEAVLAD
jgi:Circularly permutated YpsA SLOG family